MVMDIVITKKAGYAYNAVPYHKLAMTISNNISWNKTTFHRKFWYSSELK